MKTLTKNPAIRFLMVLLLPCFLVSCMKSDNGTTVTIPAVITQTPSAITDSSASVGGFVTSDQGFAVFERGICFSKNQNPTISDRTVKGGSGTGSYTCSITGLDQGTLYYARAYALNSTGTGYGDQVSFTTTLRLTPVVSADSVGNIGQYAASFYGDVTSEGTSAVTVRGFCWGTSHNPAVSGTHTVNGSGGGIFSYNIFGLNSGTKYYVRAYAINDIGTSYSAEISFTTGGPQTVNDIDGNVYNVITLGTQVWMVENLKTTRFNDGSAIPNITDAYAWCLQTGPGYCWYNNDQAAYGNPYGAIYNFYAASSGKLAPAGWHIPTHAEWTALTDYLGGASVAGGKMKEAGTSHWASPNTGADNSSGFTALPGGYRSSATGEFHNIGMDGYYWTSTVSDPLNSYLRYFYYQSAAVSYRSNASLNDGFPVRCVKD